MTRPLFESFWSDFSSSALGGTIGKMKLFRGEDK